MGYAGGTKRNPTYHDLGDHTETVEIDYDPAKITYEQLLDVFWQEHSPTMQSWSRQYAAIIFYHDEKQKQAAEGSKQRLAEQLGRPVRTEIRPYTGFTLAEEYHQKHALQRYPEFMEELGAAYPTMSGLITSTAAARLNGYVGGDGTCARLLEEQDRFGLSTARQQYLRRIVCKGKESISCPAPGTK